MRAGFAGALGIMAALLAAGPASSQEGAANRADVERYLNDGAAAHAARGHRAGGGADLVTDLATDVSVLWPVQVQAGRTYVFYGVCDDNCSDLDMEVFGADYRQADVDLLPDDTPFVQLRATRSGWAHVRAWPASCEAETCTVGVRAMSGGTLVDRAAVAAAPTRDWPARVRQNLDAAGQRHLDARFVLIPRSPDDEVAPATLGSDGHRVTYELSAGRTYRFQAACDQDCNDVDIEVLDPAGAQVAVNEDFDADPFVEFRPGADGLYAVRVWPAQCSVEPCFVGMRGYSR